MANGPNRARGIASGCRVERTRTSEGAMLAKVDCANSVEEFAKKALELRNAWCADETVLPWFRGQERAEWPLVPKL